MKTLYLFVAGFLVSSAQECDNAVGFGDETSLLQLQKPKDSRLPMAEDTAVTLRQQKLSRYGESQPSPAFEFGDNGAVECYINNPALIVSEDLCLGAAQSLVSNAFLRKGDWNHIPPGCSMRRGSSRAFWNSNREGGNRGGYSVVCRAAVQIDVEVTESGIEQAIDAAKQHFEQNPDDVVVLYFAAGTYHITQTQPTFDLTDVRPGEAGRLIFRGSGMETTTIVTDGAKDTITGRSVYRVTFQDMHFTRERYTMSQGVVVNFVEGRSVTIDLHPGYPTPSDITNPGSTQGRYLRRYTDECHIETTDEWPPEHEYDQVAWGNARQMGGGDGNRWFFRIMGPNRNNIHYNAGDLIGIKSKHGGQPYSLNRGDDIEFIGVKWTQETRGVIRGGISNVRFANCVVDRPPAPSEGGPMPCLSGPGGGPQIGQPCDGPIYNVHVTNHTSIGTGDDAIGLFNVMSGSVTGTLLEDSFARGILMCNSEVSLSGNTLTRAPIFRLDNPNLCARVNCPLSENPDWETKLGRAVGNRGRTCDYKPDERPECSHHQPHTCASSCPDTPELSAILNQWSHA